VVVAPPAYPKPIPPAQLYADLLKDYLVDPEGWQVLVRALNTSAQRPPSSSLWDNPSLTQPDSANRTWGIDWTSPPPWR